MNKKQSQKDRLLEYLQTNGTINPLESWQRLGIYRLAAVVFLLKKDGWDIITHTIEVRNQWGEPCRIAKYELVTEDQVQLALFRSCGA